MASYKKEKPVFEKCSRDQHPERQVEDTRVSTYLMKYGTGRLEKVPTNNAPEVNDPRTPEEMLDDPGIEPTMATDELDVLSELERNKDRFVKMAEEIELTKSERKRFDEIMSLLDDDLTITKRSELLQELDNLLAKRNARAK